MADSSVPVTAGSGTNIDTFTQSNGDHRQAVVLGDASGAQTLGVDTSGRASVAASGLSLATPTAVSLGTVGNTYVVNAGQAGNVTFWIYNPSGATSAGAVAFEQSNDGTYWAPMGVVRQDGTVLTASGTLSIASGAALAYDAAVEGVYQVRARVTTAATAGAVVIATAGGMPFSPAVSVANTVTISPPGLTKGTQGSGGLTTQALKDAGRTPVWLQIDGVSTTTTEALAAYTGFKGTTAVTSSTANYTVTSGKTFRITSLQIAGGGAGATVRCRVRYANAAAPSVSSPVIAGISMAFASTGDGVSTAFPDGMEIPGNSQVAFTLVASAAMSTWVNLSGFEY